MLTKIILAEKKISKQYIDKIKEYFVNIYGEKAKVKVSTCYPELKNKKGIIAYVRVKQKNSSSLLYLFVDVDIAVFIRKTKENKMMKNIEIENYFYILGREEYIVFPILRKTFGEDLEIIMHRDKPHIDEIGAGMLVEFIVKEHAKLNKKYYLEINKKIPSSEFNAKIKLIELPANVHFGSLIYKGIL